MRRRRKGRKEKWFEKNSGTWPIFTPCPIWDGWEGWEGWEFSFRWNVKGEWEDEKTIKLA